MFDYKLSRDELLNIEATQKHQDTLDQVEALKKDIATLITMQLKRNSFPLYAPTKENLDYNIECINECVDDIFHGITSKASYIIAEYERGAK